VGWPFCLQLYPANVESLYASLNIHDTFPELHGMSLNFVPTLLIARDLKINIRKRAIASLFECDKLDQAVGGKGNPLGNLPQVLSHKI